MREPKSYHVLINQEKKRWFIGRVLEKEGITTQGKSLDELVFMVRDAIKMMWNEKNVQLELLVPSDTSPAFIPRKSPKRGKLVL
jgi:predicted RNase H-like HicB family nuclease